MKSYLSLVPISAKVHRRQSRMTRVCIILAVFLVTSIFSMTDMMIRAEQAELIKKHGAENYIILRGQQNLKEVYQDYELYLSGSTSEGFGLTLMEAIGGGLPIIGFDVRYGNPAFIDDGENGYLISVNEHMTARQKIEELTDRLIRLFTEADLDSFHEHSYEKARGFLTKEVELRWKEIVG